MSNRADESRELDVAEERRYVAKLYEKLDELRKRTAARRGDVLMEVPSHEQARLHRENFAEMYTREMAKLHAVEEGLCFGRLDLEEGGRGYVGRIGIFDDDRNALLVDWRAPAARRFYTATAANPDGVTRRRHIRTRRRDVVDVSDEVLDLSAPRDSWREDVTGEAALLAALDAGRTGRMSDIVETIQAEQDRVIRSPLDGILVVQGGPGTGKTAVALHRAAYLLYEHREKLAKRGVLVIGPNAVFLRYISDVLPGLAETDVLLRTVGDMFPGVSADREEPPETARIKGDESMTRTLAAAVADRQRVPESSVHADTEYGRLDVDPELVAAARDRARACGRLHNHARPLFAEALLQSLAEQVAERIGTDPLGEENLLEDADVAAIAAELGEEPEVRAVLDWLWPELTAQQLLAGLWGSQERIAAAAPDLDAEQRRGLLRRPRSGWTAADVPLLDEAAELLGEIDDGKAAAAKARAEAQAAYAQGVLDIVEGSRSIDLEDEDDPDADQIMATDVVDAALLGQRHFDDDYLTVADRAAADRTWTFGHVIVDEAQELSPMAWRMVMRRCVGRSMTLVGDVAQTSDVSGCASWGAVLEPYVSDRWRCEELTVSYRTPAEIMAVAAEVLRDIDPALSPPRAVRAAGEEPWEAALAEEKLAARVGEFARRELSELDAGKVAVIVPGSRREAVRACVGAETDLEDPVTVTTVRQAKGLEFDSVIVVDPDGIVAESTRGRSDLYVALTRATRRLGIVKPE
ncbi:MAG: HelD family protein [Stackebrandtia sp.]